MKIVLPYQKVSRTFDDFSSNQMNDSLQAALALGAKCPCYLEFATATEQHYLFFREGQIYSAGTILGGQFRDVSINDFLVSVDQMDSPGVALYEVNTKILHSVLLLFQKKPSPRLLTSLVDLGQVLDKIEQDGESCIVRASQESFLAILRYEKGAATALCHEQSSPTPREKTFRDDFLAKIHALSAETPLNITVYEDLVVRYANDAKIIDDGFRGDIAQLYISRPPVLTLEFKGKEIGRWELDKPTLNIGRTNDNDIVIDNLAVSRLHAVIERERSTYYLRDCDSLNGTFVNDKRIGRAKLEHGDKISIGKHTMTIHHEVVIPTRQVPSLEREPGSHAPAPRLIEHTDSGDIIVELVSNIVLGKDSLADVKLKGMLVARQHAEIVGENGNYVLRHIGGYRKVSVGGTAVKEHVLHDNDEIQIGKREFIFQT